MLVRRRLVEKVITEAVQEQISSVEQIRYVLERVEEEVHKLYAHMPETIRLKETETAAEADHHLYEQCSAVRSVSMRRLGLNGI